MMTEAAPTPGFLTTEQVNSAILTLRAWSNQPWTDEDAHVWRHVLRNYRQGELSQALDHWQRTAGGRFRPTPGDLAPFLHREPNPSPYKDFQPEPDEFCDPAFAAKVLADIREARAKMRAPQGGPTT